MPDIHPTADDTEVAGRVRALVERGGWTQRRFAEEISLEETKLSKALGGRRRFAAVELVTIADRTGVTVNWLLHGRDDARTRTAVPGGAAVTESGDRSSRGARARARILDAAWELIADRGYHQVRTADVARAAGTSPAAIHYHFPTRSELLDEALRHNVKLAFDRQVAGLGAIDEPRERLLSLIDLQLPVGLVLHREWSIWIQVWAESAIDPGRRGLYWDSYDRWFRSVLMTLQDGADAGVFVTGRAEVLAHQLTALIDGLGIQVMAGTPGTGPDDMRELLHDFIDWAVLVRPHGAGTDTDESGTEHG